MKPHLAPNDTNMFYKYLDKASYYFEFGSGGSTYQASKRSNIKTIYSIESDKKWYNYLTKSINHNNFNYIFSDIDNAPPLNWGWPGPKATNEQKINYSNHIVNLNKDIANKIDFIFIDGRFRVACCLKCFDVISSECFIAFDDFLNRPYYHIVLQYFDIIDKTQDNRMVILKKKYNISAIPQDIIKKYELIHE